MKYFPGKVLGCLFLAGILLLSCTAQAVSPEQLGLGLADVAVLDPSIVHDLKYATADNFTGQILYPSARCLLREPVADRLLAAQRKLQAQGLGLKVFDCYRPIEVQRKMWKIYPDPDFVADPASGSRHNRGASVDVGLVDAAGHELTMPSSFDEFSERSHLTYMGATSEALRNRQILQTAMQQAGFLSMTTEWWHFDSPDWQRFPLANADSRLVPRADVAQILAVERPKQGETVSVMWGFEKTSRGWETVLGPIAVSLGRNGIAAFDQKKEGDGMTPRGVFALGPVFGYAAKADTRMPYRQATEQDVWIDEPASPRYNQWVQGIPSRESHEKMRRVDHLYQLGVVVGYNTAPVVAGKGSAIFLHVWKGPGATTSGCVAMELSDLARIISWLAPDKNPQIILGYQGD